MFGLLERLINNGFTVDEIREYTKTKYTLEELLNNKDIQIDSIIKRSIALELYDKSL